MKDRNANMNNSSRDNDYYRFKSQGYNKNKRKLFLGDLFDLN